MGLVHYEDRSMRLTVFVAKLQYLDWADFQRYANAIGETRANLEHDPDYLQKFHKGHLSHSKADTKKNAGCVHTIRYTDVVLIPYIATDSACCATSYLTSTAARSQTSRSHCYGALTVFQTK